MLFVAAGAALLSLPSELGMTVVTVVAVAADTGAAAAEIDEIGSITVSADERFGNCCPRFAQ